ncbi:MAG: tRNA (adenosine(37)-N6)-threonylcarbamoyltransferase complex ATPase subunit type 1 TsaE [Actinomycetota bacterium]|jgi:tRNA threonylcarbamoyladenosine biosynthesis protein TsaE|nr:tRNA (adenosine(37)-N6)-threonylcarbamoyltransferase complex ATPase subunit type 1 TsaE [Actinomycetota bacterium]
MSGFETTGADATVALGRALAPLVRAGDGLVLSGDLGAGKTQLTKGFAAGLEVPEVVTSPTFNILLVHQGRLPLYHFDLYRLEHSDQLEDVDYWGTLEADGVSVVEWGDRFPEAMPLDYLAAHMTITADETREIVLSSQGTRGAELARTWLGACTGLADVVVRNSDSHGGDTA